MPRVDIWIRKEDEEKWLAIENKPEWLHEHLQLHTKPTSEFTDRDYGELSPVAVGELDVNGKPVGVFKEPIITPPEDAA